MRSSLVANVTVSKEQRAPQRGFEESSLHRVCLVIASHRNDLDVLRKLRLIFADSPKSPFADIFVVDSQPTGQMEALLASEGWEGVSYRASERNLGAAGNLAVRLRLAAATRAEYAYAINHDGGLDVAAIEKLIAVGDAVGNLGAVYPLRRLTARDGRFDRSQELLFPWFRRTAAETTEGVRRVTWGSSNGALYALEPIRNGCAPPVNLWHGWEDLGYGWLLDSRGYQQVLTPDVVIDDNYESREFRRGPVSLWLSDKPAWTAYYTVRNLLLLADRYDIPFDARARILARVAMEFAVSATVRPNRLERLELLAQGVVDGFRHQGGKSRVP